jgi:hypothetical protein
MKGKPTANTISIPIIGIQVNCLSTPRNDRGFLDTNQAVKSADKLNATTFCTAAPTNITVRSLPLGNNFCENPSIAIVIQKFITKINPISIKRRP